MNRKINREELNRRWVMMNLRLSGSSMSEESVSKMMQGECVLEGTLADHLMVGGLSGMLSSMEGFLDLQLELSPALVDKFFGLISAGENASYRKSTPVLFHLSYNPVLPSEIEGELRKLFNQLHDGRLVDPLQRAVFVHNEIIRIYPYDEYNEIVARMAMEYELLYSGFPICIFTLSEQEYNRALAEFLRSGKERVLYENLYMDKLMQESRIGN